ncbi:hypothetical protein [Janthinobacterium sp. 17J80-10]|uniref:hypothetical protein n=1 Tax=Janthinobacterium sp. 17J80-10 TaxID=2497863 RepID=UPI0010057F3D|nr:hypothetical protein [Janthinobacterium sp. 17J80-10]QAU33586.1 hypothetical protein EKL02_04975 [Janthinobacterium sp. 17J80-10]
MLMDVVRFPAGTVLLLLSRTLPTNGIIFYATIIRLNKGMFSAAVCWPESAIMPCQAAACLHQRKEKVDCQHAISHKQ